VPCTACKGVGTRVWELIECLGAASHMLRNLRLSRKGGECSRCGGMGHEPEPGLTVEWKSMAEFLAANPGYRFDQRMQCLVF
jgi:hypothetical protein